VRLYGPSLKSIALTSADYFFLATDVPTMMEAFAARARAAGVEIRLEAPFVAGRQSETGVVLADHDLSCRILVGADGPGSQVARAFGLGRNRRFLRGVEAEFDNADLADEGAFHCLLDRTIAPGYLAWVVPGVTSVQVGLAATMPHAPDLDRLIDRVGPLFGLRRAAIFAHRGGLIPSGGPVTPRHAGNVVLTGDAAGIVSPLTGGGIHTAHAYGALLGEAIAAHLGGHGPPPGEVAARRYPRFRLKRAQRRLYEIAGRNALFELALGTAAARLAARAVFFRAKRLPDA
jgi:flavin-dependent dehydrogenase